MKKKVLCMLLVVMLSGAMLAGCGNNNDIPDKEVLAQSDETDTQPQETDEPETQEPTETPTEEPTTPQTEEVTPEPTEEVPPQPQFTFTDLEQVMYAKSSVNVRDLPNTDGTKLGGLSTNQEVAVTGQCNETSWYRISYNGSEAFVSNKYLVTEKVVIQPVETASQSGGEVAQQPVEEVQPEQPQSSNSCPYELHTWYDKGSYFFLFVEDINASYPYHANGFADIESTLKERYPGCAVIKSGDPKYDKFVIVVDASYYGEDGIPYPIDNIDI